MKRTTIIRYHDEVCVICGGKLAVNDGAVRWCERDQFGFTRPLFAHPACENPDEQNFTVAAPRIIGSVEPVDRNSRFD